MLECPHSLAISHLQHLFKCSGHGAMKENHFLDDGAYSAVQIIIETVRRRLAGEGDISIELLKQLKEAKDANEFRLKITVRLYNLTLSRA